MQSKVISAKLISAKIILGDITADVARKNIKHINVRIVAPGGDVRIAAPLRMTLEKVRAFAFSKLGWIIKHQTRMRRMPATAKRAKPDANTLLLWGNSYPIEVMQAHGPSRVVFSDGALQLHLRPKATKKKRQALLIKWQHTQLMRAVRLLLDKWEPLMGAEVARVGLQTMKTRWGSCTPSKRHIRLNTELLKYAPHYLEYVVVHELCHFFERGHGPAFKKVMDRYLPNWRELRAELNSQH
ncbi:MAG: M48 family peptidase [Alphaproteobacteria bacterium]|nr:M48 family peptidase [Alphaproteobacteria bacterium]